MPIGIPAVAIAPTIINNTLALQSPWINVQWFREKQFTVIAYCSSVVAVQPLECEVWLASADTPTAILPLAAGVNIFTRDQWPIAITGYTFPMFYSRVIEQGFGNASTVSYWGGPAPGFWVLPGAIPVAMVTANMNLATQFGAGVTYAGNLLLEVITRARLGTSTVIVYDPTLFNYLRNVPIAWETQATYAKLVVRCPTWATGSWVVSATFEGIG